MEFIEQMNDWAKAEVIQAKYMIAIGVIFVFIFLGLLKSETLFLRGALIPVGLIVLLLMGYGGYILYSRPAHARQSVALYQSSPAEAVVKEKEKHTNDNRAGKTLLKVYPVLAIISLLVLIIASSEYNKGLAMAFSFLFLITYIMDNGFIRRSDEILAFLSKLSL